MPTKNDAKAYLRVIKKYQKDYAKYVVAYEKWLKTLKPGEIQAQDGPGSNPPTPPPPPPPYPG